MLELRALTCGYGQFRAVSGLSLTVAGGEVCALVGANGAGKSSTIMAIAGHVQLHGGAILLGGEDISALPARLRVGRGIALAPEGRRLFHDLTVRENLVVGGLTRPRARESANVDAVLSIFPRLKHKVEQLAGTLSGGEQQMVAIGRALMAEPKLLMIDELSLGLMPLVVDLCYEAIATLKQRGIGILLVEQNTQRVFDVADRIYVLDSGRKVWEGVAAEARGNQELIDAFLGLKNAEPVSSSGTS
jgi:branched-chain amino acid transport system ATP-binding protein